VTALTARHATLRERMAVGYRQAEVFALDCWADACISLQHLARIPDEAGSARYGRAILCVDHWHAEADRCAVIAAMLEREDVGHAD
jgi:hypothetical protein